MADQVDFECTGKSGDRPVSVELQIIDDTRVRFSIHGDEAPVTIELSSVEKVVDGIRYSDMIPGADDERVVSTRLFHFRLKEQRFVFIRQHPTMLMVDAQCVKKPAASIR